ncbi:MAG: hypothetical protein AB7S44_03895 [Spirochaetales bacterium]
MTQAKAKLMVRVGTIVAIVVLAVLVIVLTFQYVSLKTLERNETLLTEQLASLEQVYENYQDEYDYIYNNQTQYVEDYAREVLGWGREGEIKFVTGN